jgi:hypothetical protein
MPSDARTAHLFQRDDEELLAVSPEKAGANIARSTLDLSGSAQERPTPPQEPLARTSVFRESLLCIAIRKRVLVKLLFEVDAAERLFEPTVVYLSRKRQLCVTGVQIPDPEKPSDNIEVQIHEVGKIKSVSLTEQAFVIDPGFDRFDGKYANGIICSTYRPNQPHSVTCISSRRKR